VAGSCLEFYIDSNEERTLHQANTKGKKL